MSHNPLNTPSLIFLAVLLLGGSIGVHRTSADVDASAEPSTEWLQWRGPLRTGHVDAQWPEKLGNEHLEELWRMPLAESYSGPIVTDQWVFTTETRDKQQEWVRCVDRGTGKLVWEQHWKGAITVPFFAAANGSWIRSTPVYDGKYLYVGGMEGVLAALDGATGEVRWRVDFRERYGTKSPVFGLVCSPLVADGALYLQAADSVLKIDARDGSTLWRSDEGPGGMYGGAFSSPILTHFGGEKVLVVQSRQALLLLRESDGSELASQPIDSFRGMNILTPVRYGNSIFTSAHSGRAQLWDVRMPADGEWQLSERWQNNKLEGYMSSPVILGDHAYLLLRNQRFCCIDLHTGQQTWRTKPYGKYWSIVTNGKKLLALDERGLLLLINANPEEFQLLDERKISDDPTWAHLAISGQHVFVRELKALVAYRWQ